MAETLVAHIEAALELGQGEISKLTPDQLSLSGMIGPKTRHFYNNVCNFPGCKYLEVGAHLGASTIAALYGNDTPGVTIDNFTEFDPTNTVKDRLLENIAKHLRDGQLDLIEGDFKKILPTLDRKFNVYLYDGCHDVESHAQAIELAMNCLESPCIIIVDDYDWGCVKQGTELGIERSGAKAVWSGTKEGNGWWNGCGIFVVEKN
jgi:hypothetical protein